MATNKKPAAKKETTPAKSTGKKKPAASKAAATESTPGEATVVETDATTANVKKPAVKKGPAVAKRSERRISQAQAQQEDPEEKIESAIGKTEQFIYENGKNLLTGLIIVVLIVGGIFGYKYLYLGNRSEKAGGAMYVAERYFETDDFASALNGDGNNSGFLDVIDKYGSTAQGNIAKHYAGICFMKLGDYESALEYLTKYKTVKGTPGQVINAQNYGLRGDIQVQLGDYNSAMENFRKAVDASDNSLTTPYFLKKLAKVYSELGMHKEAAAAYERISVEYPFDLDRDSEKYVGAEEQK